MFLSRDETALVLAAMPEQHRVLIEFLLVTGCRIGEALALTPADIGAGMVTFNKSYSRRADADGNRPFELGAAKTAASERTIAVSREVLDKLNLSGALVFTNDTGGPINADSFRKNVWRPAMVKSGLPKHRRPGLHDLRHTHASRLIDAVYQLLPSQSAWATPTCRSPCQPTRTLPVTPTSGFLRRWRDDVGTGRSSPLASAHAAMMFSMSSTEKRR